MGVTARHRNRYGSVFRVRPQRLVIRGLPKIAQQLPRAIRFGEIPDRVGEAKFFAGKFFRDLVLRKYAARCFFTIFLYFVLFRCARCCHGVALAVWLVRVPRSADNAPLAAPALDDGVEWIQSAGFDCRNKRAEHAAANRGCEKRAVLPKVEFRQCDRLQF